jgi:hypothetical protein
MEGNIVEIGITVNNMGKELIGIMMELKKTVFGKMALGSNGLTKKILNDFTIFKFFYILENKIIFQIFYLT